MNFSLLAHPLTCLFLSQTAFHPNFPDSFPVMFSIDLRLAVISGHPSNFLLLFSGLTAIVVLPWFTLRAQQSKKHHAGPVQFQESVLCNWEGKETPEKLEEALFWCLRLINATKPQWEFTIELLPNFWNLYILLGCKMSYGTDVVATHGFVNVL